MIENEGEVNDGVYDWMLIGSPSLPEITHHFHLLGQEEALLKEAEQVMKTNSQRLEDFDPKMNPKPAGRHNKDKECTIY